MNSSVAYNNPMHAEPEVIGALAMPHQIVSMSFDWRRFESAVINCAL